MYVLNKCGCFFILLMKEKMCYVAFDFDSEMKEYSISDGKTITISDELLLS